MYLLFWDSVKHDKELFIYALSVLTIKVRYLKKTLKRPKRDLCSSSRRVWIKQTNGQKKERTDFSLS